MSDAAVEIFRSSHRASCDERAFMLSAVGIASELVTDHGYFMLLVDEADIAQALAHLRAYETESRVRPAARPPPPRLHPHAWAGSLIYALTLIGVALAVSGGYWRLDAFDAGELHAARVQHGEWWRVWTALTLHLDGPHLAANTLAGVWFGYLASRLLGVGNAWLLIVLGAGLANAIEAVFGPASHRAVGASTAVFTSLGLISAYSWRTRFSFPQRWAARWGPLIAGIALLGWTGTGGQSMDEPTVHAEGVDVVAHALGFVVGVALGALAAVPRFNRLLERLPQPLAGLAALAPVVSAWICALSSG